MANFHKLIEIMPKDIPKMPPKTLNAKYIRQLNGFLERKIAVINGYLFYESSGKASKFQGTWFPFLGLSEDHPFYGKGWYIKPDHNEKIKTYMEKSVELNLKTFELPSRFGSIVSMLISSKIGGGFWNCEDGQAIQKQLKKDFPNFYEAITIKLKGHKSKPTLKREDTLRFEGDSVDEINGWAKQEIAKYGLEEFKIANSFEDFIKLNDAAKKEKPLKDSNHTTEKKHKAKPVHLKNKTPSSSGFGAYTTWILGGFMLAMIATLSFPLIFISSTAFGISLANKHIQRSKRSKGACEKKTSSHVHHKPQKNTLDACDQGKTLLLSKKSTKDQIDFGLTSHKVEVGSKTAKQKPGSLKKV